ncbi:hypothetical protein [Kitasatospora kifunensis]|uniref:Uncharacterized protein n=1 Tax=Kitasatospora kifunensis TaxID=58351 RepID=A0A7W7R714_KITKI|nr:hypothetical protein [Kitasatospora kifunensis]MBB4926273.1 hypothetical protein [Kitasatospora kifunensis]
MVPIPWAPVKARLPPAAVLLAEASAVPAESTAVAPAEPLFAAGATA